MPSAISFSLTGLHNRRFFEEHFEKELNRASRYNQNLALVLLDMHRFKEVNDRYGHPQGDVLLQTASNTLRSSLRTSDYAFRIGGDEFALLLVQSDMAQAEALSRRVHANFSSTLESMRMSTPLGLDFGVAVYPIDGDNKETLIRIADERLYQMKHAQRVPPAQRVEQAATPLADPRTAPLKPPSPPPVSYFQPPHKERRQFERVPLAGVQAYAEVLNDPKKTTRVLDLSYGGVALETSATEDLGATFSAVLHVPILPAVPVTLKKIYQLHTGSGHTRIGCSFIT